MPEIHFNPGSESAYREWKSEKLSQYPRAAEDIIIELGSTKKLTPAESQKLRQTIRRANMAIIRLPENHVLNQDSLRALGQQFGLTRLDKNLYSNESAISELRVIKGERRGEYIPYTNRALKWHTDGYYNSEQKSINAFILYCQKNASQGGVNELLDPEIAYIYLREKNPEYITALMQPDVFTIPETIEDGQRVRPEQKSPVFSFAEKTGALHMRYTQRSHNIQWSVDPVTSEALEYLHYLLHGGCDHILRYRLEPNEGLICNNVLHNRSAFVDQADNQRIMLRARYYDRITI
jgi:alpha-ketoglutarate-dependent taurine dioxygenase